MKTRKEIKDSMEKRKAMETICQLMNIPVPLFPQKKATVEDFFRQLEEDAPSDLKAAMGDKLHLYNQRAMQVLNDQELRMELEALAQASVAGTPAPSATAQMTQFVQLLVLLEDMGFIQILEAKE